jgi:hypothetical protein
MIVVSLFLLTGLPVNLSIAMVRFFRYWNVLLLMCGKSRYLSVMCGDRQSPVSKVSTLLQ